MEQELKSENGKHAPVKVSDGLNGMVVFIDQGKHKVALSIDQAANLGVALLNHVEEMTKKYLG